MCEMEEMMMWQDLIGQFGEWRIMTRGLFWLANFKRWAIWYDLVEWSLSGRRGAT